MYIIELLHWSAHQTCPQTLQGQSNQGRCCYIYISRGSIKPRTSTKRAGKRKPTRNGNPFSQLWSNYISLEDKADMARFLSKWLNNIVVRLLLSSHCELVTGGGLFLELLQRLMTRTQYPHLVGDHQEAATCMFLLVNDVVDAQSMRGWLICVQISNARFLPLLLRRAGIESADGYWNAAQKDNVILFTPVTSKLSHICLRRSATFKVDRLPIIDILRHFLL